MTGGAASARVFLGKFHWATLTTLIQSISRNTVFLGPANFNRCIMYDTYTHVCNMYE